MNDSPEKVLDKLQEMRIYIKKCRDFDQGAIRILTNEYLPKSDRETDAGYRIRKKSTAFVNYFSPIITGLTGLITSKEPNIEGYEKFPMDNINGAGNSFPTFVKKVLSESMIAGVNFVMVETNDNIPNPFFKQYRYEQLVSYQLDAAQNTTQLVFSEDIEVPDGRFGIKKLSRYVVFYPGGGEVWYDNGEKPGITKQDEWKNNLSEIPFSAFITGTEITKYEIVPTFYDVAQLNEVILNVETQLANILSVVGNPIPIMYGDYSDNQVTIGVKDVLLFQDKTNHGFEYKEIRGDGITKLQEKIKEIELAIDKTSFSVLAKDDNNTVIDARDNQSKSSAFLSDTAEKLEDKFNNLFKFYSEIAGVQLPENIIKFQKNFDDMFFNDKQLDVLLKMVEGGNISRETLWDKLKISGILPKEFDSLIEEERLSTEVV